MQNIGSAMKQSLRRRILLLLISIVSLLPCAAQAQSWQWARLGRGTDHDFASRITADSLGNSYVLGRFAGGITLGSTLLSGIGLWDTFVAKYDPSGALAWAAAITGPGNDMPGDIAVDRAGNIYVTGSYTGNAILAGRPLSPRGGSDLYLARLSPAGVVQWVAVGGSSGDDGGAGVGLDATGENVYVTGYFSGTAAFATIELESAGGTDVVVARYTAAGGLQWARRGGGPGNDAPAGLGIDGFGSAFIAGTFVDSATFAPYTVTLPGADSGAIFAAKYDFAGIPRWAQAAARFPQRLGPIVVAVDVEGNSYIAGSFSDSLVIGTATIVSAGGSDAFLARYNPFGGFRWAVREGDTLNDYGFGVGVDNAGNSYLTGALYNSGSEQLDTTYTERMFLSRYTPNGALTWSDTTDGGRIERGLDIAVDRIGNHYVGGQFLDTLELGDERLVAIGGRSDAFIAKLGPDATIAATVADSLLCAGGTVSVAYSIGGSFYSGNRFIAQISDSTGRFVLPTPIGSSNAAGGTILATIPAWLPAGSGYRIRVVATNPDIAGADNGIDLRIIALPHPIVTGGIDDTLCRGETVTLDAGEGFAAYRWSTGAATRTITVSATGNYHVVVTTSEGSCEGRSDTAMIRVFDPPAMPVITLVGTQLRVEPGFSHQWYRNGVAIPGATRERFTPTEQGTYTVTTFNVAGCATTSEPFEYGTTGVREEIVESGIVIERGAEAIVVTARCAIDARLLDMSGREVIGVSDDDRVELHMGGLAAGAYLLRVRGCDGVDIIRKLLHP